MRVGRNDETDVQNLIRINTSKIGINFRANVGKVKMLDGRWFDTGLPKGFSDLFGFRLSDGKIYFIEVKTETGRVRPDQVQFIKAMRLHGAIAGIARNVEDATELIETGTNAETELIL